MNPVPNGEDKIDKRHKRLSAWLLPASGSKKVVAWVLTGCVVLALCAGAAFWYLHRSLPPLRVTGTNPITHDDHGGWIAGTDGARIYFNYDPSSSANQMVSVSGGEIQKVPLGVGPVLLWDVSLDGSNLLVSSLEPNALWTVGIPGGPAHFITNVKDPWNFRWSPDGKYIAYNDARKGQEGLYVMGRDGADVRQTCHIEGHRVNLPGHQMVAESASRIMTLCGKSLRRELICIPCFRSGKVPLRNAAENGLPMEISICFLPDGSSEVPGPREFSHRSGRSMSVTASFCQPPPIPSS